MRVLLFGANGNLGQDLQRTFEQRGHEVSMADWRGAQEVTISHDVVVNAVAYNDVDGTEKPENENIVKSLNVELPQILATRAKRAKAKFVHFSTDYVFDGQKQDGYAEDDKPQPLSAYGRSKFAGEEAARSAGGQVYVCRVSKLFGRKGSSEYSKPNFLTTMIRLAHEKPELRIVNEEAGCPTYTVDIAEALTTLLEGSYEPGLYHLINEGPGVTPYGFITEAFGLLRITTPCRAVPRSAFPRPAAIPASSVLFNTKFPKLRTREEALKAFFDENPDVR